MASYNKVILLGKSSHDTPIKEIMTERVVHVHLGNTIEECMALMTDEQADMLAHFTLEAIRWESANRGALS